MREKGRTNAEEIIDVSPTVAPIVRAEVARLPNPLHVQQALVLEVFPSTTNIPQVHGCI